MKMYIEEHNRISDDDSIEVLNAKLDRIGHHLKIMMKPEEYKEIIDKVRSICTDKDIIISEEICTNDNFNSCWGSLESFIKDGNKLIRKFTIIIYRKSDFYGHS